MQRREPAGWGNPPQDNQGMQGQDNGGWPAPRNLSTGYVAPIGHRDGPSSSTAYSAPAQQQSSGRQIADNAPPDGGRGWFGEGRQSSRFSDPIQDHYSAAAAKLQPTNQSTSAGSGWQTISSDEHEARSAVSRKSSRYDPKPAQDQTQSHNEPVPPLPDLPIARPASQQVSQPAIPRPQSRQQYRAIQEDSQNAYQQPAAATQSQSQPQPSSGASNPDHSEPPQQVAASGWTTIGPAVSNGSMQPDRASSQFHAQSNAEPGRVLQSSPISATRDRIDSVPAGATVRHGLPGSSRPEPDEVWVLKDYNAMRNNMWSPTLRSPRVPSHNAEQVSSSTQSESVLVSLDDYKQSSSARAEANGAADHGSRDGAPLVPNHGTEGKENSDQSFMSVAGESIRPSESASNVGGSVASDDDNRTMRSPSRSMHPQEAPRNGKFRAFCSHNSDSDDRTGSSSPKSTFEDNPNAMTTGWDPTPAKPAMPPQQSAASQPNESANRKQEVSHSFSRELPHQQQEAKREQKQPYDNGWQSTGHQSQSGWNTAAAQAPLPAPAPTPRQSSSASYAAVNELERAATPRAARSTVSAMSRHYDAHPHSHAQPAAERSATPGISIKGASKFHAESVDLKDQVRLVSALSSEQQLTHFTQLAQAQEKIAKYERRLAMSQEELESQRIQALMAENRRLKERIAIMEAERSAVKSALVPALKILSTSGAPRQPSSSLTANGMQNQDAEVAALPRIKQETPPSAVNGWN